MEEDLPEEAICPNCEWRGDAKGITSCPECGATLSNLDSFDEEQADSKDNEKYPADFLTNTKEDDDDNME